jgi:dihydropyrimidine dehydrogenase (NAD+) subunit PreA
MSQAASYFALGCGTVQVCTAAMLDHAVGPNVVKRLNEQYAAFLEKHGFRNLDDFRGSRRDRVVLQSQIRRPSDSDYAGGYEQVEGYASPEAAQATA